MLREKLSSERFKRLFILLLLPVMLVFLVGGVMEYRHRGIVLLDRLGLSDFRGENVLEILRAIDTPQKAWDVLRAFGGLLLSLFPATVFNSLPVLIALRAIPWLASRFIHALYDTKDLGEAHKFLHRNVFGMEVLRPIMIVRKGRIAVGEGGLYDRIGGRGLLIVYNDSAAVLEKGGRLIRVLGPSLSFLGPFERIWEVVDLRPQRWPFTVNAMTKEGIPIACDADLTFKIDDRVVDQWGDVQKKPPSEADTPLPTDADIAAELEGAGIGSPLPYTEEAVFKAATAIWVRIRQPDHKEQLRKWTGRVMLSEVEGSLRSILADYRLDWLMRSAQSGHESPREEIRDRLDRKLRGTLSPGNKIGARIMNVDIGKIDVKDESISKQWVEAWQAEWKQRAVESQAEGEAAMARLQVAQVQAQAEMALALTEAIRPLVINGEGFSSYDIATRFVEALWWMSYSPGLRAFLPPDAMWTLKELDKMLNEEEEEESPERDSQRLSGRM